MVVAGDVGQYHKAADDADEPEEDLEEEAHVQRGGFLRAESTAAVRYGSDVRKGLQGWRGEFAG